MITENTRNASYNKIKAKIPDRKTLILQILEDGPKTAHEIVQKLLSLGYIKYYDRNFVSPRLTELKDEDLIETVGTKYETMTDRTVSIWSLKEVQE